jgi:hypothetical protein
MQKMDKPETLKILAILRVAYPNFYKGMSAEDYEDTVILWCDLFKDDTFMLVSAAVKTLIVTDEKGYPPNIGAVKSAMAKLTEPPVLTEMEAWNMVRAKLSAYATHEEFMQLPEVIRRAVGSASQLCQWAMTDMESLPVIMSNFMRSYRSACDAERERKRIPSDVRKMIDGARGGAMFGISAGAEKNDLERPA